jgi:arginase family enzyme
MASTTAIVFPFDAFGNAGTAAGAQFLDDFLNELLDDNAQEDRPMRPNAYAEKLFLQEVAFDTIEEIAGWKSIGRKHLHSAIRNGERVIWLGGNHLSVLPVYEELGTTKGSLVLQFDAHLDVYQLHDINPNPSNGNFLLHAETSLPAIVNIGHRDLFLPPAEVKKHFAATYSALDLAADPTGVVADLRKRCAKAKRIWIDLDADAFDPPAMPGVHHPLPGGLTLLTLLQVLTAIWDTDKVVGLSISEFDPSLDRNDTGANLLGWLLEWWLLKWYE